MYKFGTTRKYKFSGQPHYNYNSLTTFGSLVGKTLVGLIQDHDYIIFFTEDEVFYMYHNQNCCESVTIESVVGDWNDVIDTEILTANESTDGGETDYGTYTWTFYTLRTIKGTVDLRWHGESNGYYSESVDFIKEN